MTERRVVTKLNITVILAGDFSEDEAKERLMTFLAATETAFGMCLDTQVLQFEAEGYLGQSAEFDAPEETEAPDDLGEIDPKELGRHLTDWLNSQGGE